MVQRVSVERADLSLSNSVTLDCRKDAMVMTLLPVQGNWSGPRVSSVIYLGDVLHIEASVAVDNHVPLRLYVDSCIATLSGNKDSEPRYAIVDKLRCLMDSKAADSSSSFRRPALNKLRFDITAFRFQGDSRSLMSTCGMNFVIAIMVAYLCGPVAALPEYKLCNTPSDIRRWVSEERSSAVFGCCDAGSCSGTPRFLPPPQRQVGSYGISAGINWRGKWPQKRAAPLDPAGQDPRVHVKEITIGPLTVVHVARDPAAVLCKESLYHPLQLVEVQTRAPLSLCWQSPLWLWLSPALSCCPCS
ncbi:zona pellucida sperm-binding protein 3-like [Polyodon spathula]|uniref:zona pellucida sperm-binding protein 3-like n=1 Tax=Polyodon spathula TaxID=7913 RepID=UPI001B7E36A7|nr:zona pellucida sperm-binding protein 3-like [Polyodon spathula]